MPLSPEEVVLRYQSMYGRLREGTAQQVETLWLRHGGPDDSDVERFLASALPVIQGGEVAAVRLVTGYMATMARLETGSATEAALDAGELTGEALRGVAPAIVYARPAVTVRSALAKGLEFTEAMNQAAARAATMAQTDIALAQRAATTAAIEADTRIVGYRRVLTGSSCSFCATASTQRYHGKKLMPLHGRCDCGVAPIFGDRDPGQVINKKLVADLKSAARETGDRSYWNNRHVRVEEDGSVVLPETAVHQHGELGPVLTAKSHDFTGPSDLVA